jgi:hypothetical protein
MVASLLARLARRLVEARANAKNNTSEHQLGKKGEMKMNSSTKQKERPKGLISIGVVLAAIVISLLMQGTAQAWWISSWLVWRGGW